MTPAPDEMASMFDEISPTYDALNTLLSMGNDRRWRDEAVARLAPADGETILDLGCGTAELLLDVHQVAPGAQLLGVDVAQQMLRIGRDKALDDGAPIDLVRGDALDLPLPDASIDGAITAFTLRNVPAVAPFFEEVRRVLEPGGRVVALELHLPEDGLFAKVYRPYFLHVLPRIGDLLSGRTGAYKYLMRSVAGFHSPDEIGEIAREAGFDEVTVEPLTFGTAAITTARLAR